ncbi:MAG: phospholipase D family protein, partial [Rhodobacteraceae bacterium]|nr:phospholipase D family protein [Paracoccaceae bacterium]
MRRRGGRIGRAGRALAVLATVIAAPILVLRLLFPLPAADGRTAGTAIAPSERTALGASILPLAAAHPGTSGVMALENGIDAFAARMALIHAAEVSIDAQYYIWQDDLTGLRLLSELSAAANRGVRVRLLVDDNG